ncbi:uncharacterized protein BJ212DRAFT_1474673 [Suillus subaureus]|uniref:Mid2 domain-containing protein n=1 Tax=Suillus subaureus TaxID=48587 RepID=A0A9P7EQ83_9AGAM|nr:uncharacterized protein BJ212DRAFT_1474673 [Suillus subaureus]KAG1827524.1 hypothetical protein BJ212DRAFT_1474673 [Suillus subaureus]
MSCTLAATATQYTTITTFTTSTSLSQSVLNNQATVTTIVQQTCIATGTLSGSNSTGCLSSAAVTQVNTIGGGAVTTQVPIIATVPVTQTQPTNTLFASCSDGSTPSQTTSTTGQTSSSSTPSPVTTSVLVETTPAPSIITQSSSTTLSNGDVVATLVTTTSTLPASSVYVPSVIASPTVTGTKSGSGSGTDVAPIVGGVLGGFVGLIVVVSALWYFCRRRRSWDDIFDREAIEDEEFDSPVAVRRSRDRTMLDLGAEPKPYQYGLVGHVTPPPGSGSSPSSHHPSFSASVASTHSRNTSVTPLLGISSAPGNTSKVSISGSTQAAQTAAAQRHLSATSQSTSQSSVGLRSLSVVSTSSATPLLGGSGSSSLSSGNRVDELGAFDPLNRTGSPAPVIDRRVLQIINDGPQSPKSIASPAPAPTLAPVLAPTLVPAPASSSAPARPPGKRAPRRRRSNGVVVHTDAGSVSPNTGGTTPNEPPPYSRE